MSRAILAESYGTLTQCAICKQGVTDSNFYKLENKLAHTNCYKCSKWQAPMSPNQVQVRNNITTGTPCYGISLETMQQMQRTDETVPYSNSKLTYLCKGFIKGAIIIKRIIFHWRYPIFKCTTNVINAPTANKAWFPIVNTWSKMKYSVLWNVRPITETQSSKNHKKVAYIG